ncbi:MAG: energy-coupling factor transporter ATPase [Eubacteriales bacterium]|jgi:energy-coupling factor transport system ATP-binding protein
MNTILETRDLHFVYGGNSPTAQTALNGINLTIREGEFLGLIGHTGSGKTTFVQHLNGLLKPTSGQILYRGEDIHANGFKLRGLRFKVGLVFQYPEHQLFEETVARDIAFGPRNMGLSDAEVAERVRQAAAFVGLGDDVMDKSPFDLSGGQKRRAAIAGVIAMRPEVLILDEPTAGLDPYGAFQILSQIRGFRDKSGSTVVLVTHNMETVARAADRLVVFSQGTVAMDGTPEQIFGQPERLEALGLDVPQVSKVFMKLRELGIDVETSVYTVKYAKNLVETLLREGGQVC